MNERFPHAMLAEIYEQPAAIERTLEHYADGDEFRDEAFGAAARIFKNHRDLIVAASGSSRHAGLAAEIMFEDTACLAVDVEYASEYIARSANTKRDPAVLVISQSGETADTLAALREANSRQHPTLAVTNVEGSTMMREADVPLLTAAGVEKAIPATKSFTAQLVVLRLLSLFAAKARGELTARDRVAGISALRHVGRQIGEQLDGWQSVTRELAEEFYAADAVLFLGRGIHYAIAREGALKLKESSYVQAEGYPAGELKHGPNALVSASVPLVAIATVDREDAESVLRYSKTVALLEDLKKQGATTVALANRGDDQVTKLATHVVEIDAANEYVLPIAEVVPLQMFAYAMAVRNGIDVDRPRNLVKSVMVE
jgi:glucosamine--fructose-6-phosphate aminotransferase (isomerizing)